MTRSVCAVVVMLLLGPLGALVLPARAAGQIPAASITGTVADETGAPVADATVDLFGPVRRAVRSGQDGRFVFAELPPGDYRVAIEREGFAAFSQRLTLGPSAQDIGVTLQVAGFAEYVETVSKIREEARRLPFLTNAVEGEQLRTTGAATFEEALVSVPGLQHGTQGNAFTRVATRGLRDTADVLVVLDGVPFRQLNGSADLTMLPVQAMQEIEFVKGPASSVYGRSAIGGVMQVFTVPDPSSRPAGEARVGLSSFGTGETNGNVQAPWRGGRVAGVFAVSRSDGFQDRTSRDTNFASVTADQTVAARAQLRGQYLVSDVDATRGSIIPLENGRPMFGITRDVNFGIADARFEGRLYTGTVRADVDLGRGLTVSNTANFNRYDRLSTGGITIVPPPTASNKGWNESTARQDTFIDDAMLRWDTGTAGLRSALLVGATVEHGTQDQQSPTFTNAPTYRGPDYTNPLPGPTALNDPRGIRGASVSSAFEQTIVSLYAQERLEHGRVGGVLGFRWDDFDQSLVRSDVSVVSADSRSKVSPRLGLDVVALQRGRTELTAFANWVQGFRPQFPALSTQAGLTVPQLLRPEVTRSAEGGVKWLRGTLSGQVGIFNMRKIDGQRSFRSGPDDFTFVNATSRVRGVESESRVRIAGGHTLWAHYSFQTARHIEFRPTLTSSFAGYRVRMAPRHIWGTGASVVIQRVTWTSSLSYVGSRPLRDNVVDPQMLPSYTLLDSSVSVPVGRFRLVVFGANLTDTFYIGDDFSSQNAGNAGTPRRLGANVIVRF